MEESKCLIRPLKTEDIPAVLELHRDAFGMDSGLRFFEKAFYPTILDSDSTGFCLTAVQKRKIIGFATGAANPVLFHRKLFLYHGMESFFALVRMALIQQKESSSVFGNVKKLFFHQKNPSGAWIFHVAVDPKYRGRGTGRNLFEALLEDFSSHDIKRCWTRTLRTNQTAIHILKDCGFTIDEELSRTNKRRYIFFKDIGSLQAEVR